MPRRERLTGRHGALHAVFMETEAPIGPAIPRPATSVDLPMPSLRGDRFGGKDRMAIRDALENRRRIFRRGATHRHTDNARRAQPLKAIDVLGDQGMVRRVRHQMIVPGRPGQAASRKKRSVYVQHGFIRLITDRPENFLLQGRRVR